MPQDATQNGMLVAHDRSQWIRLQTLSALRWVAVAGQLLAISIAESQFGIIVDVGLCTMAIGLAVAMNLVTFMIYPENKRLTEIEAALMLLFDLCQLGLLVALTGGLHNPFALLMLTPVVISATALHFRTTLLLGTATIALVSLLSFFYLPLQMSGGSMLQVPDIFLFGHWAAIVIGVAFLSFYAGRVASEMNIMSEALWATQNALAREQKLTDLGGVVAAAAHELGTPLATIKLTSSELVEELPEDSILREDAELIREQADRCRDILRWMGRAGKDDLHMHQIPFETLVKDAAEPHLNRGKSLIFDFSPSDKNGDRQPTVLRRPEVVHGLRNLIQNAVDFSSSTVWVVGQWDNKLLRVSILDDGPGFSAQEMARIGDPFMRRRRPQSAPKRRPGYEGMGLGLFIAKTLLERSGAELTFANAPGADHTVNGLPDAGGAMITVTWPSSMIRAGGNGDRSALGENRPFES